MGNMTVTLLLPPVPDRENMTALLRAQMRVILQNLTKIAGNGRHTS